MPTTIEHAPGAFCWMELGTTDQEGAKAFYGSLFGWAANDFPMGPSGKYTIFKKGDADSAAAFQLNAEMLARGVPPHWMLYMAVADADASARRATDLGGKIVVEPFDVMDMGRMAVMQDPAGAMFSIWQAAAHHGIGAEKEDGAFCWADLNAPDQSQAKEFYEGLFGWTMVPEKGATGGYLHIQNGTEMIGGVPSAEQLNPHAPPHWMLYFQVADCDASTAKTQTLGGKVHMPPISIPGTGRMSVVADPQGAAFALFEPPDAA